MGAEVRLAGAGPKRPTKDKREVEGRTVVTVNKSPAPTPPLGQLATRYEKEARPVTGSRGPQDFPLNSPAIRSLSDASEKA